MLRLNVFSAGDLGGVGYPEAEGETVFVMGGHFVSPHVSWMSLCLTRGKCCCLSSSFISALHRATATHPQFVPLHPYGSCCYFLLSIFTLSIALSHLCLCVPSLPPSLQSSFPAKRLAGVFSTVMTFKTKCHPCLTLTCLSLCLLLLCTLPPPSPHRPPAARTFWTKCCA